MLSKRVVVIGIGTQDWSGAEWARWSSLESQVSSVQQAVGATNCRRQSSRTQVVVTHWLSLWLCTLFCCRCSSNRGYYQNLLAQCSQCDSPILVQLSHHCHVLLRAISVCSSPLFGAIEYCSIFERCHQPCKVLDTLKPYSIGLTMVFPFYKHVLRV